MPGLDNLAKGLAAQDRTERGGRVVGVLPRRHPHPRPRVEREVDVLYQDLGRPEPREATRPEFERAGVVVARRTARQVPRPVDLIHCLALLRRLTAYPARRAAAP